MTSALLLPGPLGRYADASVRAFLQPPATPAFDFTVPPGAPALAAADSVAWRIFKNPVAVLIGGVAAVLLELAEPRIREPLWERTSFRTDPLRRLQRTGLAAMITVYGAAGPAAEMIAGVGRIHARISGTTAAGIPYRADDPDLLDWVQATASFGILEAYAAFARPLSAAERDQAYAEALPAAALYGATGAPRDEAGCRALFDARRDALEPAPAVFDFLRIMKAVPALPAPARPLQPLLIKAAVDLLPDWVRTRLRLGSRFGLATWERPVVRALAAAADRIVIPASPAVLSCRRLGLPDDHLYRRA